MRALVLLCPLILSMACSTTERVVLKPEIIEIIETEYVAVPADLTTPIAKQERPDGDLVYGGAIYLWSLDRATVDKLNGRLKAIESLGEEVE